MVTLNRGIKSIEFDDVPKGTYIIERTGDHIKVTTDDPVIEAYFRSKGLS